MARRKLLPTDAGLTLRMITAAVLTPLVVIAAVALVVVVAPARIVIVVGIATVVGIVLAVRERAAAMQGVEVGPADEPELHAIVERLCVVADLAKPALVLERRAMPNSWIEGTTRGGFHLHLTQGLLDLLEPRELEAVIAHELAHVANRDAAVMTVVGGPGTALLGGGRRMLSGAAWITWMGAAAAMAIGWVASLGTRALSRYREFAADAGSVALTGSAAALASALMKVSEGISAIPERDLRLEAARDTFHLLPVARDGEDRYHLPATHPSLEARIARLEKLEHALQRSRSS
jgi:heat shock protein HtpX